MYFWIAFHKTGIFCHSREKIIRKTPSAHQLWSCNLHQFTLVPITSYPLASIHHNSDHLSSTSIYSYQLSSPLIHSHQFISTLITPPLIYQSPVRVWPGEMLNKTHSSKLSLTSYHRNIKCIIFIGLTLVSSKLGAGSVRLVPSQRALLQLHRSPVIQLSVPLCPEMKIIQIITTWQMRQSSCGHHKSILPWVFEPKLIEGVFLEHQSLKFQ